MNPLPDATTTVLLPGMDGTGVLFAPLVAALPTSLAPVVVTYPGDEELGYEATLPFARAASPRDAPFVLVGESFSGPIALRLAAERPPGLRGVVLCATFASNPIRWMPRSAAGLARPGLFRMMPAFARLKALAGAYATPELDALLQEAHRQTTPRALAARARAILAVDAVAELRDCPVPVLYLRGRRDKVVPRRVLDEMLRVRPTMNVVEIDAPHLVLQTAPKACAKAIEEFVSRTS